MNTVTFERRDFSGPQLTPGLSVEVERLSWRAVGGPWKARLKVRASDVTRLWQAAELVRCGVKVFDELGPAWWGYVSSVELHWNAASIQIGVTELANDVMVRYKSLSPDPWGGQDAFTSAAVDSTSIARYGRREQVYELGPATVAQAEAFRAAKLARYANPFFSAGSANAAAAAFAESRAATAGPAGVGSYAILECRGWWETLDWLFYADSRGAVGNTVAGSNVPMKVTGTTQVFAQSFQAGAEPWTLTEVWLRVGKEGFPTDNLSIVIARGTPATAALVGLSVAGKTIPNERVWLRFVFTPLLLVAGETYWVKVYRSVNDTVNFYNLSLDETLSFQGGDFRMLYQGSYVPYVPDGDLSFMVRGTASQDTILSRMLSECGQFFEGVRMETVLGFEGIPYRDGRQRGRQEIEALLSQGTAAGARLLARVESDRWLRVYAQPGGAVPELAIGPGGALSWRDGRRLHCAEQAAGRWARLGLEAGAIERAGAGGAPGTGAVFVEACAWTAAGGLRLSED